MIHDINEDKLFNLSQEDWDDIIERYFEADTSEDEERLLLRFLATPQANDIRFNEIKAVMGFAAVGKKIHEERSRKSRKKIFSINRNRWIAAAVIGCIFTSVGWKIVDYNQNVCVAYVGGEKITNPNLVMMQMKQSLHSLDLEESKGTIDNQLNDIFSTISNNNYDTNE